MTYTEWKQTQKPTTIQERIAFWEKEGAMTKQVYGRKMNSHPKGSEKYREARNQYFRRIYLIEEQLNKEKALMGTQSELAF